MAWPANITVRQKDIQAKLGVEYNRDLFIEGTDRITNGNRQRIVQAFNAAIAWQKAGLERNQIQKEYEDAGCNKICEERADLELRRKKPAAADQARFKVLDQHQARLDAAEKVFSEKRRVKQFLENKYGLSCPTILPFVQKPEIYIYPDVVEELWDINLDKELNIEGISELTEENKPQVKQVLDAALEWKLKGEAVYKLLEQIEGMDPVKLDSERKQLQRDRKTPTRQQKERFRAYDKKTLEVKMAEKEVAKARQVKEEIESRYSICCVSIFPQEYIGKAAGAHLAFKLGIP